MANPLDQKPSDKEKNIYSISDKDLVHLAGYNAYEYNNYIEGQRITVNENKYTIVDIKNESPSGFQAITV